MEAYLKIVLGFLLTGIVGNWLLQKWQARTWLLQQRFLGKEKEYVALKELVDEMASLLGVRIFRMRRLNRVLAAGAAGEVEERSKQYDEALQRWNERLASFYIRLPMLAEYRFAWHLENTIQNALVKVGGEIDELTRKRKSGGTIAKGEPTRIEEQLNKVQGRAIRFTERLLSEVRERRVDVYYGKRLPFVAENLRHFSTWQLIKALFVRDINSLAIIRASLDS
jgi:hypothetical protein